MTAYDGWSFTWQGGRQLAGMSNGMTTLSFDYNESGLRTKKSDGSTTHKYIYRGEQLIADVTGSDALYFRYDQNGDVLGFSYNGAEYTYVKNLQGDILAILDSAGAEAATYTYDAWGNTLSTTGDLAMRNPLRYRGYMYDTETGLYYLQSRYYDPEIGRFVNADDASQLGATGDLPSYNLYGYCGNNPVLRVDSEGGFWNTTAGAVAGAVISAFIQVADNAINGRRWHDGIVLAAASGAITGALAATGAPKVVQSVASGVVAAGAEFISQSVKGQEEIEWGKVAAAGVGGAVSGWIGGNGIRHKKGALVKAERLYDYALDGMRNSKWDASRASHYFDLAARNFQKVAVKELNLTTAKYAGGGVAGVAVKDLILWFD